MQRVGKLGTGRKTEEELENIQRNGSDIMDIWRSNEEGDGEGKGE